MLNGVLVLFVDNKLHHCYDDFKLIAYARKGLERPQLSVICQVTMQICR